MKFNLRSFVALLFVTCLPIAACRRYNSEHLWNEATTYFTNPLITKDQIFQKMSPNAIRAVIGAYPVDDSAQQLIEFFEEYKNDHNYKVEKYADTVCIEFNPQKKIAGGPLVYILDGTNWKVIDIVFGK